MTVYEVFEDLREKNHFTWQDLEGLVGLNRRTLQRTKVSVTKRVANIINQCYLFDDYPDVEELTKVRGQEK